MGKHTPGPVSVKERVILHAKGHTIAMAFSYQVGEVAARANAARLARCWNCQDELVEAIELMLRRLPGSAARARAAIAKATESEASHE